MDASAYAFSTGVTDTRRALAKWNQRPLAVLGRWMLGSACAAALLLAATLLVGTLHHTSHATFYASPPFERGSWSDVRDIFLRNCLVLALHAMACVAGFIAGSSLPLQAARQHGVSKWVHEQGGRLAMLFVAGATTFSLSAQAWRLGTTASDVAAAVHVSPALLLLGLLPHAVPELIALFLPLAAWIMASRRGRWDELLAATLVTVTVALPILFCAATWETFGAPHVLHGLISYP